MTAGRLAPGMFFLSTISFTSKVAGQINEGKASLTMFTVKEMPRRWLSCSLGLRPLTRRSPFL